MYNRQEYSHNFALSDMFFNMSFVLFIMEKILQPNVYVTHISFAVIVMFLNDLHICSKRHYHDINFPGRAVAFSLNEDQGGHGRLPSKKDKYSLSSFRHYRGCPLKLQSESKLCALPKNFIFL